MWITPAKMKTQKPPSKTRKRAWTAQIHVLTATKRVGRMSENLVIYYLKQHDWIILERNYQTHRGEIDIIAMHENIQGFTTIAFIEVKSKTSAHGLNPAVNVTASKRQKITHTMRTWIGTHKSEKAVYRCDIAAIVCEPKRMPRIRYYPCAFTVREAFGW